MTLKKGVFTQFGIIRAHKFKRPDFFVLAKFLAQIGLKNL